MRPVVIGILALVLALGVVNADFNISAHLYDNEGAASVVVQELSVLGNNHYVLYTIGGIPSILTADDIALSDEVAISTILRSHYENTVLPTPAEWSALRAKLMSFNDSRNVKANRAPLGVEETCLIYTNLKSAFCNDTSTCALTANQLCVRYDAGTCSPDMITPYLADYGRTISSFNSNVPSLMSVSQGLTLDNAVERFSAARASVAALRTSATAQMQSKLRVTNVRECPDCLGICPQAMLDTGSLDEVANMLDSFSTRLKAVPSLTVASKQILQATADREAYAQSAAKIAVWAPKWAKFKSNHTELYNRAQAMAALSRDVNFTSTWTAFQKLWTGISTSIPARNLATIDSDFNRIQAMVAPLQAALTAAQKPYDAAKSAQRSASDSLIAARWRVNPTDRAQLTAYNQLVSKKAALDASFSPPLTSATYANLTRAYMGIVESSTALHPGASSGDPLSQAGRAFSQQSVNGFFSLTAAIVPFSATTRAQIAGVIPPAMLLLIDLALASVLLVVFIGVLVYFKPLFKSRVMLGVWMAMLFCFLFGLGLGSVGLYVVMSQGSSSNTLGDFQALITTSGSAYVAIDQTGAPSDALTAMASCAKNITAQVKTHYGNKTTVGIFNLTAKTCAWGNQTNLIPADCLDRVSGQPLFILHYNKTAVSAPRFSTVYQTQAEAWGDAAYYTRCEIGDVLN